MKPLLEKFNRRMFILLNHCSSSADYFENKRQAIPTSSLNYWEDDESVFVGSSTINKNLRILQQNHTAIFTTIHTGIVNDPDASKFEFKRPIFLDLRKETYAKDQSRTYPYTSIILLEHIFNLSVIFNAMVIHLKYIEDLGDCYVMFRTPQGLVPYSTINNKHWIQYLMVHSTGQEDLEKIAEGEYRLEALTEKNGRLEFTVNILYIQGGVKLTLARLNYKS